MMSFGKGIWQIPKRRWEKARREVWQRAEGKCENCGLHIEVRYTKDWATDRPAWTVHHKTSIKELKELSRELCKALTGVAYRRCVRKVFVDLATDPDNLQLRCHRRKCRIH